MGSWCLPAVHRILLLTLNPFLFLFHSLLDASQLHGKGSNVQQRKLWHLYKGKLMQAQGKPIGVSCEDWRPDGLLSTCLCFLFLTAAGETELSEGLIGTFDQWSPERSSAGSKPPCTTPRWEKHLEHCSTAANPHTTLALASARTCGETLVGHLSFKKSSPLVDSPHLCLNLPSTSEFSYLLGSPGKYMKGAYSCFGFTGIIQALLVLLEDIDSVLIFQL